MGTLVTAALYPQIWKKTRLGLNGFYNSNLNQIYSSIHPHAKVQIMNGIAKAHLKKICINMLQLLILHTGKLFKYNDSRLNWEPGVEV